MSLKGALSSFFELAQKDKQALFRWPASETECQSLLQNSIIHLRYNVILPDKVQPFALHTQNVEILQSHTV